MKSNIISTNKADQKLISAATASTALFSNSTTTHTTINHEYTGVVLTTSRMGIYKSNITLQIEFIEQENNTIKLNAKGLIIPDYTKPYYHWIGINEPILFKAHAICDKNQKKIQITASAEVTYRSYTKKIENKQITIELTHEIDRDQNTFKCKLNAVKLFGFELDLQMEGEIFQKKPKQTYRYT